ncbi:MAG: hypothetical protein WCP12_07940 [bacterium]
MKKNKTGNKPKVVVIAEPVKGNVSNEATELIESKGSESLNPLVSIDLVKAKREGLGLSVNGLRHLLPDALKGAGAFIVIIMALVILLTPPLVQSDFPKVTYSYKGTTYTNATLCRPLAMPNRYYIALPKKIEERYQYFAVDRRREVATLMTNTFSRTILGIPVIKRSDPMGLDLEFRHFDNSEWQVFFLPETILFSNAVLAIRLDVK